MFLSWLCQSTSSGPPLVHSAQIGQNFDRSVTFGHIFPAKKCDWTKGGAVGGNSIPAALTSVHLRHLVCVVSTGCIMIQVQYWQLDKYVQSIDLLPSPSSMHNYRMKFWGLRTSPGYCPSSKDLEPTLISAAEHLRIMSSLGLGGARQQQNKI